MKKSMALSAVAALGLAVSANAAVLHITSSVVQMTNMNLATGSSTTVTQTDLHGSTPHDFKITYFAQVTGLTGAEQGFGNLAANVTLGDSVVRSTLAAHKNYSASGVQKNNFGSPAAVFSIDGDQGSSTSDLQGIVVSIPSGLDPAEGSADDGVRQFQLAALSDGPVAIGSVWVSYTGTTLNKLTTLDITGFSTSNGSPTALTNVNNPSIDNQSGVSIGLIPEPASLSLLGLGALGLIGRRRQA